MSDSKTLLELARAGEISPEMQAAARAEGVTPEFIRAGMVDGNIVVTRNRVRKNVKPLAIGAGLRIKVNANIGTSRDHHEVAEEMAKLKVCEETGADTVMDLSTGGPLRELRQAMIKNTDLPIGTVPIYQAMVDVVDSGRKMVQMKGEDLLACLDEQGREGVDFMTVHCGVTQRSIERIMREGRVLDVVSRGGSLTVGWMHHNQAENHRLCCHDLSPTSSPCPP